MDSTTSTALRSDNPRQRGEDERLTLSQAARIAPGSPTPNCVWRWCRRGVLARAGGRVRLRHVRIGGKLFTTARWLDEFGQRLADADAAYFEIAEPEPRVERAAGPTPPRRSARTRRSSRQVDQADEARRARIRAELEAEGL